MKPVLTTWLLLFGLLLQSVAWALPAQAARLAHEVAHAIDHGHHQHRLANEALGHDVDPTLQLDADLDHAVDEGHHGPHHSHASEGVQLQGLLLASAFPAPALPRSAPRAWTPVQPPSADPLGLLRPPQRRA